MSKNKKKKKKEKVTYFDDGRTIADMSGTNRVNPILGGTGKNSADRKRQRGSAREQMHTFFSTMRQMVVPMLIVMGIIAVAYGVMYLLFKYGF